MSTTPHVPGGLVVLFVPLLLSGGIESRTPSMPRPVLKLLEAKDQSVFYHLEEGSELFPAQWLAALTSVRTGKPFLDELERFGAIPDPAGPEVKSGDVTYRLPVGLTLARSSADGMEMIGVNCAACHVGELRRGKAPPVRINGGPSMFDIEGLYQEAFKSFGETLHDRDKLREFLGRLAKQPPGDKVSELAARLLGVLGIDGGKDGVGEAIIGRLRDLLSESGAHSDRVGYFRMLAAKGKDHDERAIDLLAGGLARRLEGQRAERLKIRIDLSKERADAEAALLASLRGLTPLRLAQLEARVVFLRRLRQMHAPDKPQYPPGPGRVDAFVTARNLLFSDADALPATSPVRFPAIWPQPGRVWLHYDANTNSVLERNIGQALGLGALATPDGRSTVLPRNLSTLEKLRAKLEAPGWPAGWPRDKAKADKGKLVYEKRCAGCHERGEGEYAGEGGEFRGFRVYKLDEVGTDPERAENFARPLDDGTPFVTALAAKLRVIKKRSYEEHGIGAASQQAYDRPDHQIRWVATRGYVARPLRGAWASAPYLHNGSVPTLRHLLLPEKDRPVVFPAGVPEYDPVNVGVVSTFGEVPESQRKWMGVYDTRVKGNSNRGHSGPRFGTDDLSDTDRENLLEYLKDVEG